MTLDLFEYSRGKQCSKRLVVLVAIVLLIAPESIHVVGVLQDKPCTRFMNLESDTVGSNRSSLGLYFTWEIILLIT